MKDKDWSAHWDGLEALINYRFSAAGRRAMKAACLHGSMSQEIPGAADLRVPRRRLAWIGDRVVGLVLADLLALRSPDEDVGSLNAPFDQLKKRTSLARAARRTGLSDFIVASANGLAQAQQDNPLGEFLEAVVGAVYRDPDGGFDAARQVAKGLLAASVESYFDPEERAREREDLERQLDALLAAAGGASSAGEP